MKTKSTRLVYTDEQNLAILRSLPEKDFKEFMMTYLTYQKGMDVSSNFTNPLVYTLFLTFIPKIEYNEDKWEKKAQINRENGKKGGRPRKNNIDIQSNNEFENEVPIKIPSVQFEKIHSEEQFEKDVDNAVNELIDIALSNKGQDAVDEVVLKLSNNISEQYNKPFNDVKTQLIGMAKEEINRRKRLREVS